MNMENKKEIDEKELNKVDGGRVAPDPAMNKKTREDINNDAAKKGPSVKKEASLNQITIKDR